MNMNNYLNFKWICNKIHYEIPYKINDYIIEDWYSSFYKREEYPIYDEFGQNDRIELDVREIIYTQPFMDKLRVAMLEKWYQETWYEFHMMQLITRHLNNPIDYLNNLLKDE